MSYVKGIAQALIVVAGMTAATVGSSIATDKVVSERKFSPEFREVLELTAPFAASSVGYVATDLISAKVMKTTPFLTRNIKALKVMYNA